MCKLVVVRPLQVGAMTKTFLQHPVLSAVPLFLGRRCLSLAAILSHPRGTRRSGTGSLKLQDEPSATSTTGHLPVMKDEVVGALSPEENQIFVDMTFGAGGHTRALLNHGTATAQVYALDRDPDAHTLAQKMAQKYNGRLHPLLGCFSELETLLRGEGLGNDSVDGILIDAGCSSIQFDTAERGFSIRKDGPLDMRMDGTRFPSQPTASDVVNSLDAPTLAKIFKTYGEEPRAKRVAAAIVEYRQSHRPIRTTGELATVISCAFTHTESRQSKDKLGRPAHVATKTFQALRIFVNNELNELSVGLEAAGRLLKPGGKFAVLTFHSLEDRVVKRCFQGRAVNERGTSIHQKRREHLPRDSATGAAPEQTDESIMWAPANKNRVLLPSEEEIEENPRSRSAKLRVAVKL